MDYKETKDMNDRNEEIEYLQKSLIDWLTKQYGVSDDFLQKKNNLDEKTLKEKIDTYIALAYDCGERDFKEKLKEILLTH
jgi:hypothetical protein